VTRDISESISDDELYDGISAYLTELDRRSRIAADDFWTPSEIVKDPPSIYNELRLILEELSSYHLIETQIEMGDQGLWAARITPAGRHLLRNAKALQNDPDGLVAGVARSVTINNTTITGSTVGNLASGGTDVTFSGAMSIIQHPQAKLLESAFKDLDTALAQDTITPPYVKAEAADHIKSVRAELAKPPGEADQDVVDHRWNRVTSLLNTPTVAQIVGVIGKAIISAHGGDAGAIQGHKGMAQGIVPVLRPGRGRSRTTALAHRCASFSAALGATTRTVQGRRVELLRASAAASRSSSWRES